MLPATPTACKHRFRTASGQANPSSLVGLASSPVAQERGLADGPVPGMLDVPGELGPASSDRRVFRGLEENEMNLERLEATADTLVPPGKGILAADESHPSIGRRFEPLGIPNTEETAAATVRCSSPPPAWRTP